MTKISGSGSISQRHGSADPDPHKNVMDRAQPGEQIDGRGQLYAGVHLCISIVDPDLVDPKPIGFPGSESVILNYGYGS
jgi:hypothetical protein